MFMQKKKDVDIIKKNYIFEYLVSMLYIVGRVTLFLRVEDWTFPNFSTKFHSSHYIVFGALIILK